MEVDDALVDAHLEAVPGLGTLTAGGLAGGDAEDLGGHADRATDNNVLGAGGTEQRLGNILQSLHVARSQSNADLVERLNGRVGLLGNIRHLERYGSWVV